MMRFFTAYVAVCWRPLLRLCGLLAIAIVAGISARADFDSYVTLVALPLAVIFSAIFIFSISLLEWAYETARKAREEGVAFRSFVDSAEYPTFINERALRLLTFSRRSK